MSLPKTEKIWMNGKFVDWDDAKIHVGSHVVHYGSSVFEGIRCYKTKGGSAVFRLQAHIDRLYNSGKIYRMDLPYHREEFMEACLETIRVNRLDECYIRPFAYRGYDSLGINPFPCPIEMSVMVWEWGKYLGAEALEKGVPVKVSTWFRLAPNTLPVLAKAGGHYLNSQLIKMEAVLEGYAEGIALDAQGNASEGSGENLFMIKDNTVITPPYGASILPGITRDSVLTLAKEMGLPIVEGLICRESLYLADELFFTGTAAEITPISSVDRIPVGNGARGPITQRLQERFFSIIHGEAEDIYGWLTPVERSASPQGRSERVLAEG